jgi:hypothetical protein
MMYVRVILPIQSALADLLTWAADDPIDATDLSLRAVGVAGIYNTAADNADRLTADGWQLRFDGVDLCAVHPAVATRAEAQRRLAAVGVNPDTVVVLGPEVTAPRWQAPNDACPDRPCPRVAA